MLHSRIDHLVVTAPSLSMGVEYIRKALGVTPQTGGEHPSMATHNCLLKLGERLYLEVISINPEAGSPTRSRWFQLDDPGTNQSVRFATWVTRTNDLQSAVEASPIYPGEIESMNRGDFDWQITIKKNGALVHDGLMPTLIQWQDRHPADTLRDSRYSLIRLEGFHSEAEKVNAALSSIGFDGRFSISPLPPGARPHLVAYIDSPKGMRKLRTHC